MEDFRDEFVVAKNIAAMSTPTQQEDFWTNALHQRDYSAALQREGIKPAAILDQLIPRIFQAGKSIEILARLNQLMPTAVVLDAENNCQPTTHAQLYDELLANIRARLPARVTALAPKTAAKSENPPPKKSAENRFQEIVQAAADDEYLARAFGSMFVRVGLLDASENPREEGVGKKNSYILEDCLLDPLRYRNSRRLPNITGNGTLLLFIGGLNVNL